MRTTRWRGVPRRGSSARGAVRTFGIIDAASRTLAGVLESSRTSLKVKPTSPTAFTRDGGARASPPALSCSSGIYLSSEELGREAVIRVQPDNHSSAAVARRAGFRYDRHHAKSRESSSPRHPGAN